MMAMPEFPDTKWFWIILAGLAISYLSWAYYPREGGRSTQFWAPLLVEFYPDFDEDRCLFPYSGTMALQIWWLVEDLLFRWAGCEFSFTWYFYVLLLPRGLSWLACHGRRDATAAFLNVGHGCICYLFEVFFQDFFLTRTLGGKMW